MFCFILFESTNSCCVNILSASYLGLVDNLILCIYAGLPYKIILHIPNIHIYVFIPTEHRMMCIGRCCRWTPKQRWFYIVTRRAERDRGWAGIYLKGNAITSASTVSTDPRLMSFPEWAALWIFMKVTFDSNLSWNPYSTTLSLNLWKSPFILFC